MPIKRFVAQVRPQLPFRQSPFDSVFLAPGKLDHFWTISGPISVLRLVQFLFSNALTIDFGEDDGYFGVVELPFLALAGEAFHHYGIALFWSELDELAMRTDGAVEGGEGRTSVSSWPPLLNNKGTKRQRRTKKESPKDQSLLTSAATVVRAVNTHATQSCACS